MESRPYLDFYAQQGAALVSREIGDRRAFFRARAGLFVSLGIAPGLLDGKSVLEFGPGTGHNALFTDSLRPRRFVLVDGDEQILQASRERLKNEGVRGVEREFVCAFFDDYSTDERFDIVIAEACIPNQVKPSETLNKMLQFLKPGGVMIFTTVSAASWLSEITRRLVKLRCTNAKGIVDLNLLISKLEPHFKTLKGMARQPREWILDNLVQPLDGGRLFSIPNALEGLASEYLVSGLSPMFLRDWRWYKENPDDGTIIHDEIIDQYYANVINFLDRRSIHKSHSRELGERLEAISAMIWDDMRGIDDIEDQRLGCVMENLHEIASLVSTVAPATSDSIEEAIKWFQTGLHEDELFHFPDWWGRGQQHVGLVKPFASSRDRHLLIPEE